MRFFSALHSNEQSFFCAAYSRLPTIMQHNFTMLITILATWKFLPAFSEITPNLMSFRLTLVNRKVLLKN